MGKFKVTIKAKAKHGIIYDYIREQKLTLREAADKIGICVATLQSIIHFRWMPTDRNGETLEKLCIFFECTPETLFPPELTEEITAVFRKEHLIKKEVELISLEELPRNLLAYNQDFDGFELARHIDIALERLSEREQKVIRARFGLGGEVSQTQDDIAKSFGLAHGQSISQIEIRALKKLRHPAVAKKLKDFIGGNDR